MQAIHNGHTCRPYTMGIHAGHTQWGYMMSIRDGHTGGAATGMGPAWVAPCDVTHMRLKCDSGPTVFAHMPQISHSELSGMSLGAAHATRRSGPSCRRCSGPSRRRCSGPSCRRCSGPSCSSYRSPLIVCLLLLSFGISFEQRVPFLIHHCHPFLQMGMRIARGHSCTMSVEPQTMQDDVTGDAAWQHILLYHC